ncbi:Histone-lysine N-methyltransferase SETMAR [Eumeta japonica]|uniref:Histone-lysine N-methyltransferase SETMAR n=1 Tax=Eumeta variegata TaxID=151549 RepID=A0A4C1ZAX9_EUMVA|nr:Histone-lysine N-methyltransferase SETMAR [Eumeta japonica]
MKQLFVDMKKDQNSKHNSLTIAINDKKNENMDIQKSIEFMFLKYDELKKIGNITNCTVKSLDRHSIIRTNPKNSTSSSIIVEFTTVSIKDDLLKSTREFHKKNTTKLNSNRLDMAGLPRALKSWGIDYETVLTHLKKARFTEKVDTWVPYELTERNLMNNVLICDSPLKRNEAEPFWKRIISDDEKWIAYDKNVRKRRFPKGKQAPQTIAKPGLTRNKYILCVWWDWKGIIHYELLPPGKTIDSDLGRREKTAGIDQWIGCGFSPL